MQSLLVRRDQIFGCDQVGQSYFQSMKYMQYMNKVVVSLHEYTGLLKKQ